MKSKGFTLVELLAVISILSLLALITSTVISNSLREAKTELTDTQNKSIKLAAEAWGSDNINKLPTSNSCTYITLQDLLDDGFLEPKVINPDTKNELSTDLKIKISSQQNKKNLIYEINSTNVNGCTYIGNTIHVDLPKGLTPVVYDEDKNSWRVPKDSEDWYNYDEQKWANAVVLGKGKTKKPGDIVAVDGTEALMMLVYIPRFEYKIEGDFGKGGQSADLPGEIEVKFIKKSQTNADEGYILHPAFNFDGANSGFWVGKFELSHETLSPSTTNNNLGCSSTSCTNASGFRILPNVSSLRYNNVSNFWYGIKSIENTSSFGLSNIDTHMMKNSEWGAVAYLSQSKYGKYGNSDYEGANKEIYQNKSSSYITGSSNGTPSQSTTNTQCAYNDMQDLGEDTNGYKKGQCGPGASTTGNIYGVYDMSGGSSEYVMGAYGDNQGIYSGLSASYNSGFNGRTGSDNGNVTNGAQVPDSKYYDVYANATNSEIGDGRQSCNNGKCLGHAMSETASWYRDYANMVTARCPWFVRGGSYYYGPLAGVFARYDEVGYGYNLYSARVVGFGK